MGVGFERLPALLLSSLMPEMRFAFFAVKVFLVGKQAFVPGTVQTDEKKTVAFWAGQPVFIDWQVRMIIRYWGVGHGFIPRFDYYYLASR